MSKDYACKPFKTLDARDIMEQGTSEFLDELTALQTVSNRLYQSWRMDGVADGETIVMLQYLIGQCEVLMQELLSNLRIACEIDDGLEGATEAKSKSMFSLKDSTKTHIASQLHIVADHQCKPSVKL